MSLSERAVTTPVVETRMEAWVVCDNCKAEELRHDGTSSAMFSHTPERWTAVEILHMPAIPARPGQRGPIRHFCPDCAPRILSVLECIDREAR